MNRQQHLLALLHVCGFDATEKDANLILEQMAIPALDRSWDALASRNGRLVERNQELEAALGSLGDPSRTSVFEYATIDGVPMVRTVTTTAWKPTIPPEAPERP